MSNRNRAETYVGYFEIFYDLADERCRAYWGSNRPNGQAAGLESLVHFGGLVFEQLDSDALVIDAGAGASSAILRTYFKNVVSCDPDADYLAQVQCACEAMGLGHGQWVAGIPDVMADATFYDYGAIERKPNIRAFLDRTKRIFWFDDAHDADLMEEAARACGERGLQLVYARRAIDEHGRFGAYAVKGDAGAA